MNNNKSSYERNIFKNIFIMSRPPFHIVGILPFILGTVIADRVEGVFSLPVFILALLAVIFIMLVTYYNGEYYDIVEDRLAAKQGKNAFSGGSQVIAANILPRKYAKTGSFISLGFAVLIGLVLQFYYKTGLYTILLGLVGIFLGFFYSNPPFRFVSRGLGEIFIGFCYGWLPVGVAFYIQAQKFSNLVNWVSIPVALSIFNVILINQFPDYYADMQSGKRNIVVRIGKQKATYIYSAASVLSVIFFALSVYFGVPFLSLYIYLPFALISLLVSAMLIKKYYDQTKKLEALCGATIIINIGTTLAYIIGIALKI